MNLNEKIIYCRKKAGMSQIDLADVLGVSRQTVSKWETGESNPEITKLPTLAKALDVSVDWLLSDEELVREEPRESYERMEQPQARNYPEWVDHLPSFAMRMVKQYGWLYGVYMAVAGAIFAGFGLFMRALTNNFMSGMPSFASDLNQQASSGFSMISGFVIGVGLLIATIGAVLAVSLRAWGRKNPN